MKAIIVTGGKKPNRDILLKYIENDDYIIGVDSGCNCLYEYNINPNLIMGDFDSVDKKVLDFFVENNVEKITLNVDKDYSDTQFAYEKAKDLGYKNIVMFGASGTRIDHSLGNIGLMFDALANDVFLEMIDDNNRVFLINKETVLKGQYGDTLSFIPMSDKVKGVTIKGAKYLLDNYDMTLLEPRALSNEFLYDDITISFSEGIIMVIYSRD